MTNGSRMMVVGIGVSAAGAGALEDFFSALPIDTGMAFVVVQCPDATRKSAGAEIVRRHTKMAVRNAADQTRLEPNTVYVPPPDRYVAIQQGRIKRVGLSAGRIPLPVDFFFRSLARSKAERAVGIVLSGGGSHGTLGVREIRCAGGMIIGQEPKTAEIDAMPRNAIDTGMVDFVLPPREMAGALINFAASVSHGAQLDAPPPDNITGTISPILDLVAEQTNQDFHSYSKATVYRRILRRMGIVRIDTLTDYLAFLRSKSDEAEAVAKDLLTSATSFFRDPDAFEYLRDKAIKPLVRAKKDLRPLRVWVPGCATGEEAYSIAMVLLEATAAAGIKIPVQIFASDLDREALKIGRAGIYPESIVLDVPPRRLQRFFARTDQNYRINKEAREMITFTAQNLVSDPPFSKLDLINCQNLLGHIEPELQRRVVQSFAFALKPGGFLRLARSDATAVNSLGDRFEPVSADMRIYRRTGSAASYTPAKAKAATPKRKSISSVRPGPTGRPRRSAVEPETSMVGRLEKKLKFTKHDSHLTVYDYEASMEELRAANEEIRTINEELRLANQELESSQAQLQTTNEKLTTVNSQLTLKVEELNLVNDDLTNFLDASDIATVILDSNLNIKRFAPSATKLFNFVPTDLGRSLEQISNKLLDKNILSFCQRVLDYLIPLQQEIQSLDGYWYEMHCIPYRTLSNRIEGVVMTFVDVSARKAAELELKSLNQELEERVAERVGTLRLLQAITVSANEATAVEEVLRSALARTCEYMRWPVGHAYLVDPSGKKLFSSGLWHAADTEKHALFRKAIEGLDLGAGEGLPGEVLATRRSLWLADISHRSTIQKNHPANQAGLKSTLLVPVLMQKDVVAVLEFFAPESREPNSRWLEVTEQIGMQVGRVFERKHAEARLKENERLAAIGTATAKMAHEINNPLSNIYAGVQFLEQELLEKKETGDTLNMMTDVRKEVDRLTRLMGDLRTFLVTGRQHLNLEPVDVSALAVEILRLEGLALGQRSIRLLQEIRANLPRVQGDPNKLKEVLVNLTRNSMDAMPEGGTLTVRTYQEGNHICLEVTDTGEGIAESLHPLEQPVTTKRQGIGLGLLIVRQNIADHGGTVTYTTRPGHGTTFRVTLPLAV